MNQDIKIRIIDIYNKYKNLIVELYDYTIDLHAIERKSIARYRKQLAEKKYKVLQKKADEANLKGDIANAYKYQNEADYYHIFKHVNAELYLEAGIEVNEVIGKLVELESSLLNIKSDKDELLQQLLNSQNYNFFKAFIFIEEASIINMLQFYNNNIATYQNNTEEIYQKIKEELSSINN